MTPTSTMCRLQQAYHRNRASDAALENVRIISAKAAVAWGHAALLAEKHEERLEQRRVTADAVAPEKLSSPDMDDEGFSENPDRGLAVS